MTQTTAGRAYQDIAANVAQVVRGKDEVIRLAVACLLAEGHLLIEDVPGLGKTRLARSLARSIGGNWRRIQFTPDLLPSDVTGTVVFYQPTGQFEFRPGAVFTNIVLADEVNRGTPKTQAALLEVMEERTVTVDTGTYAVPRPFMVIATQNPVDMDGTYRLPEAQLDRFLMRINVGYPAHEDEMRILRDDAEGVDPDLLERVIELDDLQHTVSEVRKLYVDDRIVDYTVRLVAATREEADLRLGASPRAGVALLRAARGWAATSGRDHVWPEDIKKVAHAVLDHRLILEPGAEMRGRTGFEILEEILQRMPVPTAGAQKVLV